MLQFILGRSGTGKTSLCIEQITENLLSGDSGESLVYLVPEQATYQAERAILSDSRIKGYSRLYILSFQRLCYMIFGNNIAARPLTSQAREMIVHKLLCENAGKLSVFASSAQKPGMAAKICASLCELQQYGKTPDDVDEFVQKLSCSQGSEFTKDKLSDINLIYKQYLDFVAGNFFNTDNQLNIARQTVGQMAFLKGCKLWVDGFAGFTTSEMLLLVELLKAAGSSKIALCLDPAEIGSSEEILSIFYPTLVTYGKLKAIGLKEEPPVILKDAMRFKDSKSLGHIEKNIFSFDHAPDAQADGSVKITACSKARTEVEYVAGQVRRLVMEEGFRWRDIAVIASDLEQYRHFIQAIFTDVKIPFFIDRIRSMQQYPAAELIINSLKIAAGRFTTADVMSYLKSDLVPVSRADVDMLENYCLAFNIEADDWLSSEKWDFALAGDSDFDNKKIEMIRQNVFKPLLGLRAAMQQPGPMTAERFRDEIFAFLDGLNVRDTLEKWTKAALESASSEDAQFHQQFFKQFTQLMDDFVFIFADSQFSPTQYITIIISQFSRMSVALIPPSLDQVLVGSIERSRHPDIKAVFLIGSTAKQFPVPVYYDNILNDKDRQFAQEHEFELARSGSMQLMERRYLAYIAFTRSSRQLHITYPIVDDKGGDVQCSFFIGQLKSLFSNLNEETYYGSEDSFAGINSFSDLSVILCRRLGRDNNTADDNFDGKCKWLLDSVVGGYDFAKIAAAIGYDNKAQLDSAVAAKLYPHVMTSSATRLRTFASCPYQYFANYILRLKERRIFELKPLDLGQFYHSVLEKLFYKLKADGLTLTTADTPVIERGATECIEKLLVEDSFLKKFRAKTKHNSYIVESASEIIKDAILEFAKIAKAGSFNQVASETAFGQKAQLPAVEIDLSGGRKLCIEGKIDRIDIISKEGKNYAAVFDYKTSKTTVDYSRLAAGLDMQLPIYMLALSGRTVDKYSNIVPLGSFYVPIQMPLQSSDFDEVDKVAQNILRKAQGIFNGDSVSLIDSETNAKASPFYKFNYSQKDGQYGYYETSSLLRPEHFEQFLSVVKKKLTELGELMAGDSIEIKPYKYDKKIPCTYCLYKPVCRFDRQINNYADIKKISKTEFFE